MLALKDKEVVPKRSKVLALCKHKCLQQRVDVRRNDYKVLVKSVIKSDCTVLT